MATKIAKGIISGLTSVRNALGSILLVKTSQGVLYALIPSVTNGAISLYTSTNQGNTWTIAGYATAPTAPIMNSVDQVVTCAIDSQDNIHIVYGLVGGSSAAGAYQYTLFNTTTNSYGPSIPLPALTLVNVVALAVDSNNNPHVISCSGSAIHYTNKINTYKFKTGITISATDTSILSVDLLLDQDNVPQIVGVDGTNGLVAYIGNRNDASVFTRAAITTSINTNTSAYAVSIGLDNSFNTWIAYQGPQDGFVYLVEHIQTNGWTTWQTPITDNYKGKIPSLAINGTDIYVAYERSAGGLAYDRYNSVQGNWLGEQLLQPVANALTTNVKYHNPLLKWSTYFDNGLSGTNNQNQNKIEYLFDDGTSVYYAYLDTAQITTGYVNFSFSTGQQATTTSTSSTSVSSTSMSSTSASSTSASSTSTSISSTSMSSTSASSTSISSTSSSTSQSTSTSISSTSSSTSTSVSSTSQSTSTSISSTSSSTSTSISSTSTSISTSTSLSSTSSSISTSSTSSSTSTSQSSTSSSQSTSTSLSSTSSSTSTTVSFTTSTSLSSTSSSQSTSTSLSSTSSSTSTSQSSTSSSTSQSTSSTSQSTSTSLSSTSSSTSTSLSSTSSSTSSSQSTTSQSTSTSHSTTSQSTSTSISSTSSSFSSSTSVSSTSTSFSTSTSTSTSSTSTSVSSTSSSTSSTTTLIDRGFYPRGTIYPVHRHTDIDSRRPLIGGIRRRF